MEFSPQLGEHFSGNGDSFAAAHNTDRVTNAQGFGTDKGPRASINVGPQITSMMRFGADQPDLRKRFTVQDLTMPRAVVDTIRMGLGMCSTATYPKVSAPAAARRARDLLGWNTDGAMNHTVGMLIMAHDTSDGRIVLNEHEAPQIDWPSAPADHIYKEIEDVLAAAVKKLGGGYLHNPRWGSPYLGNNLVTAHPLGGCTTADDPDGGVVDHAGRVFDPDGATYDGLYVCDGSVIPRALAVNPLFTISMFAERAADELRGELGLPLYDAARERDDRA
jgi:cholesterol oxidase